MAVTERCQTQAKLLAAMVVVVVAVAAMVMVVVTVAAMVLLLVTVAAVVAKRRL